MYCQTYQGNAYYAPPTWDLTLKIYNFSADKKIIFNSWGDFSSFFALGNFSPPCPLVLRLVRLAFHVTLSSLSPRVHWSMV